MTDKITDFNYRVTNSALASLFEAHNALPIVDSSSKQTKASSGGQPVRGKLVGDMTKKLAEFHLKLAQAQLESTKEIYLASIDDAAEAAEKLARIVGQVAKQDVRQRQVIISNLILTHALISLLPS